MHIKRKYQKVEKNWNQLKSVKVCDQKIKRVNLSESNKWYIFVCMFCIYVYIYCIIHYLYISLVPSFLGALLRFCVYSVPTSSSRNLVHTGQVDRFATNVASRSRALALRAEAMELIHAYQKKVSKSKKKWNQLKSVKIWDQKIKIKSIRK